MEVSRRHFLAGGSLTTLAAGLSLSTAYANPLLGPSQSGPNWQIGYSNMPVEGFSPTPMQCVYGKPPTGLMGNLYRNGPAQFKYGANTYASHLFDGDGMVQRISIEDGQAIHAAKFVQTAKRKAEQAQNKFVAPGFGSKGDPSFPVANPDDLNAANTSVIMVNGELLALWEAGSAIALDPESLETQGAKTWRDDLAGMPFLAHPKTEPDGTVWNLAVGGKVIGVYKIRPDGTLQHFELVDIGMPSYIHDWAMTDKHLIIMLQPWIHETNKLPIADNLVWRPELGFRFLIIDKDDFTNTRWAQGPARAFYHSGAAWAESDGTIRIDAALYEEPAFGAGGGTAEIHGNWKGRNPKQTSRLTQIIIPPNGDAYLEETNLYGEFLQTDGRLHGTKRALTAIISHPSAQTPGFTALSVHNWVNGKTDSFIFGDDYMVEEFLFVPMSPRSTEQESWLIGPVLNLKTQTTDICVFDARNVHAGPVCIWRANYAWSLGFHGFWA